MNISKLALSIVLQLCIFGATQAQTLRVGLQEDPDILDPAIARLFVSSVVLATICDRLFVVTPDGQIVPQLATGYSWSEDRRARQMGHADSDINDTYTHVELPAKRAAIAALDSRLDKQRRELTDSQTTNEGGNNGSLESPNAEGNDGSTEGTAVSSH